MSNRLDTEQIAHVLFPALSLLERGDGVLSTIISTLRSLGGNCLDCIHVLCVRVRASINYRIPGYSTDGHRGASVLLRMGRHSMQIVRAFLFLYL